MSGGRIRFGWIFALLIGIAAISALYVVGGGSGMLNYVLNPPEKLTLSTILFIAFVLGILHGATPDEHTWPITFSYAVGSYSTRKGMKAGFAFSLGFTAQRALLTTLGFLGLAAIYKTYNLDGPVYILVGIAMAIAGAYILNKRKYIHLPFDLLFRGSEHHTEQASRLQPHEEVELRHVSLRMAIVHGLIAGFGFGAYATIIVFILAPRVPGLIYAPLPGLFFGLGTMVMQIVFGALFSNLARLKGMSEKDVAHVGRKTAGRTLYYGGMLFAIIGLVIVFFPEINSFAISTGNHIPNLDSIGVATLLVLAVVGVFGIGNLILGIREILRNGGTRSGGDKKASAGLDSERA